MPRYEHLIFVCTNAGRAGDTKARCGKGDAEALLARLQACVQAGGRKGRVRVTRSGCLDMCAKGCAVATFREVSGTQNPQEHWYARLGAADAEALFVAHVERNEIYVPQPRPAQADPSEGSP